ncbi:hypothetical protein G7Y89_g7215 [Cudoniella acicularis]|uniref:Uncharacterized protein n=1 Tax=Cudoniella acicularis TaxID=354080 RepID=A0A8H4RLB7_9HELO|nr:hypothetical protein G7Y89_g7215 [Cudoniella acicularis]
MPSPPPQNIKINLLPRPLYSTNITYNPSSFSRIDETSDAAWYSQLRFVQHIDDGAISALKSYYSEIIKSYHRVLDLCSCWVSRLPPSLKSSTMIEIGMNARELEKNPHLAKFFVKDLNLNPEFKEIETEKHG